MKRMMDRRTHSRLRDSELVVIHWREGGREMQQLANVDDISAGGMRLLVDFGIAEGTEIEISYESLCKDTLTGVVRHSFERCNGTFLGIEFTGDSSETVLLLCPELLTVASRPVCLVRR